MTMKDEKAGARFFLLTRFDNENRNEPESAKTAKNFPTAFTPMKELEETPQDTSQAV